MQAFLTIFQWIILNRWIHKHLIWSCNLRDFNFKRYKQPFSGLYTSANSDLHMMTKRIPFLQQNFSSTLWNVYFLTFVALNFKLYSLIFHFIQVSCTGTTSLLKCKIHTIHFQISFPLLFWTIKNIKSFTHHRHLLIHMYNTKKAMSVHNLMKTFTLVRFSITLHFLVHGKDLRFSSLWRNNLTLLRDNFFFIKLLNIKSLGELQIVAVRWHSMTFIGFIIPIFSFLLT